MFSLQGDRLSNIALGDDLGDRDRVFNEWALETYKKACKFAKVELKSYDANDVAVRWFLPEQSKGDVQDIEGKITQSTYEYNKVVYTSLQKHKRPPKIEHNFQYYLLAKCSILFDLVFSFSCN